MVNIEERRMLQRVQKGGEIELLDDCRYTAEVG